MANEQTELEAKERGGQEDAEDEDGENEDTHDEGLGPVVEEDALDDDDDNDIPDYGDDEDDPFLKAIGGADKLLTGEADQRKLMEQMKKATYQEIVLPKKKSQKQKKMLQRQP